MKDEPINKYVGSVLHTHRKKLRYSQEYVARRLDVPRSSYQCFESGRMTMSFDVFLRVCEILNIDAIKLVDECKRLL